MGQKLFWVSFGSLGQKNRDFGSPSAHRRSGLLRLFPEQHVGNTFRRLCLVFLNDVGIKVFCGVHAGVPQLLGHRDDIGSVCQEDRGYRVAERMRIDVGQAVAGGEVFEPAGDAVRVHPVPVILGEHIAGMQPSVTVCQLEA